MSDDNADNDNGMEDGDDGEAMAVDGPAQQQLSGKPMKGKVSILVCQKACLSTDVCKWFNSASQQQQLPGKLMKGKVRSALVCQKCLPCLSTDVCKWFDCVSQSCLVLLFPSLPSQHCIISLGAGVS